MLQIRNQTPYQAQGAVLDDHDGTAVWVVVVKATFDLREDRVSLADAQEPVCLVERYHGEPGRSSLRYDSELSVGKPGTDIIVDGQAHAPRQAPATCLDVAVRAGTRQQVIRVHGDRRWYRSSKNDLRISEPEPFLSMPLRFERAFGGTDRTGGETGDAKGEGNLESDPRNPIGTGFAPCKERLVGRMLPNLEDPAREISDWRHRPDPVGLGPRCRQWEPRRRRAGTFDERWREERMPLFPLDFDPSFYMAGSADLAAVPHLRGGEPVELWNLTPSGHLAFHIPRIALGFRTQIGGRWRDHRGNLVSVIIEPEVPRLMLVWSSELPCTGGLFTLRDTMVYEKRII